MVRRLKENGQWDNTIFIFTSDNGTSTRIVSQTADGVCCRGGKGDPRGVGTSVPLIVCWGDRIAPRVSERLADFTDFFPTFADAMRIGIPAEWKLDGVSLYPEIAGQKPLEKEISLMHYNPLWPTAPAPYASRAARTAEYKYYWDGRFYNTKEDFMEEHPIDVASCSDEVKAIYHKLKDRVDECPDFRPDMPGAPRRGDYGNVLRLCRTQQPVLMKRILFSESDVFDNPSARQLEERLKRLVRRIRESHPQTPLTFFQTEGARKRKLRPEKTGFRSRQARSRPERNGKTHRKGTKIFDKPNRYIFFPTRQEAGALTVS